MMWNYAMPKGVKTLPQAMNFSLDVQEKMQGGTDMADAIRDSLDGHQGRIQEDSSIHFPDGSQAVLGDGGFVIKGRGTGFVQTEDDPQ